MSTDVDSARTVAGKIIADAQAIIDEIVSEEDAKIQLIQRLLVECLGWRVTDVRAETSHENGYSDYILKDQGVDALLLEAKRLGRLSLRSADKSQLRRLKLAGAALAACQEGIDQAARYAAPNGFPVAVLTDGETWIVFKAFTPGSNFKERKGFVFPSFAAILNDFPMFYDLLGKSQFGRKVYRAAFDSIHEGRGALGHPLVPPLRDDQIKIATKSSLAHDLEKVLASFFSKISDEHDSQMLIDCFVESRESRIADYSLEKMAASVLANIVRDRDVDSRLAQLITSAVDVDQGETVFIVGPTGSGKSTFLDRFFAKTLDPSIRQRCLVAKVNCLDSTGSAETAVAWLTETLISALEQQLFEDGVPGWDDLQGLYHLEYLRRSKGADKFLYESDKDAFKLKFGEHVEQLVEKDREGYLRKLLSNTVNSRKMLPIILVDNSDEFTLEFKEALFQGVQSLRRFVDHCLVLFPLTDKSAWSLSKTDIYGIYQSKSFFLPTPPPREVFRKRVEYLRKKLEEERTGAGGSYFTKRGITVSIDDLVRFASALDDVFVNNDFAARTVGELANYNIRRTLALSKRVITSAVFKVEEFVKSYVTGAPLAAGPQKFMNALLRGDYEVFKPGDAHEIFPLFKVDGSIKQSPLMNLRILSLLHSLRMSFKEVERQHLPVQSIFDYFDAIGATEAGVDASLTWLLEARLVEPYDSSVRDLSPAQRLAISYAGQAHWRLSSFDRVFVEQLALTTAMRNEVAAEEIRNQFKSKADYASKMASVRRTFLKAILDEDATCLDQDVTAEQYANQSALLDNLRILGGLKEESLFDADESPQAWLEDVEPEERLADVEWFDAERGYGFVRVEGIREDVFLHADRLKDAKLIAVGEGDVIRCTLARTPKGYSVANVLGFEATSDELDEFELEIVRLFDGRSYGFATMGDRSQDVFFSRFKFSEERESTLRVGDHFRAKIAYDRQGRVHVREVL